MEIHSEDLIEKILLRLPCKSLLKFKTVSKQWLRLISSNRFAIRKHSIAQAQTLQDPSNAFLFFFVVHNLLPCPADFITPVCVSISCGASDQVVRINPNIGFPIPDKELISAVLVPLGFGIYCVFERVSRTEFLWNPTTRETKLLPKSPYFPRTNHVYCFGNMCYEDGNFSYKVGRIAMDCVSHNGEAKTGLSLELYSSKTRSWKSIPNFCSSELWYYPCETLHCSNLNGRAHLLIRSYSEDFYITSFDYEAEIFRRINVPSAPPEVGHYDQQHCFLTLYDDKFLCLLLSWINNDDQQRFIDIWVMREYEVEDSWIREFTVGPVPMDIQLLGFSNKVRGVFWRNWKQNPTELFLCDCKSSNIKSCGLIDKHYDGKMQVVEQAESLVSKL